MLWPTISATIRQYYKNMKGKTDKTKEQNSHFAVLFKLALIVFTS
jgi:hypothetical protein